MNANQINEWLSRLANGTLGKEEAADAVHRLRDMVIRSVHLVDRGANKRRFVVTKNRGDPMPKSIEFGPTVVETDSGSLITADAGTDVEKQGKATMYAQKLMSAGHAIVATAQKMKAMSDEDFASYEAEFKKECMGHAKALAGMAGYAMKAEDEEDKEKRRKAKGKDEEDEEKRAKAMDEEDEEDEEKARKDAGDVDIDGLVFDGVLGQLAQEMVTKAGRRMSKDRMTRLKDLLDGLQKLANELEPRGASLADTEALINQGLGKLEKSLSAQFQAFAQLLAMPATGAPVPDGQSKGDNGRVRPTKKRDDNDRSWIGFDLNDPDLHEASADPEITFFED